MDKKRLQGIGIGIALTLGSVFIYNYIADNNGMDRFPANSKNDLYYKIRHECDRSSNKIQDIDCGFEIVTQAIENNRMIITLLIRKLNVDLYGNKINKK